MTCRPLLVLLAAAGLLLAGCSDDGGGDDVTAGTEPEASTTSSSSSTTTTTTTTAAGEDTTCADLDVAVLDQVEDPGPDDVRPEDAPPPPEEVQRDAEIAAALDRIAEGGPAELRADATTILDLYDSALNDPDAVTDEDSDAASEAGQRLVDWGIGGCEVDGPIWSCVQRGTFRLVGASIDEPGGSDIAPDLSPEDAVGSVQVDPAWEMVEVERTDERVTFAWLDEDGLAVRSETAALGSGGDWSSDQTTSCDTGLERVPPDPNREEDVPLDDPPAPPGSSSVPTE